MAKKVIGGLLIFVLVTAGIVGGIYLVQLRQEIRKQAAPSTTIYFEPTTTSVNVGETVNLDILVDTGGNSLSSVLLDIDYDPTILQGLSLTFNESLLPNSLKAINLSLPGKMTGSAGADREFPISGSNQRVASVSFRAIATSSQGTTVSFGSNTSAYTGTEEESPTVNLITQSPPATVFTDGSTPTATPTESDTTPTATPTESDTTPTATPTAGSPTPTKSPTPTPTTDLTLTPTPTVSADDLPETGFGTPTLFLSIAGGILLLFGLSSLLLLW